MHLRSVLILIAILILVTGSIGCMVPVPSPGSLPSTPQSPSSATTQVSVGEPGGILTLQVESLMQGALLPADDTCTGPGRSPAISWDGVPEGTESLVLILDDPDAPSGTFTHWIAYNISPGRRGLISGISETTLTENGIQMGVNSAGLQGYYPPCPPYGSTHRYIFRLYALDTDTGLPVVNRESVDMVLSDHTIGVAEFDTLFRR